MFVAFPFSLPLLEIYLQFSLSYMPCARRPTKKERGKKTEIWKWMRGRTTCCSLVRRCARFLIGKFVVLITIMKPLKKKDVIFWKPTHTDASVSLRPPAAKRAIHICFAVSSFGRGAKNHPPIANRENLLNNYNHRCRSIIFWRIMRRIFIIGFAYRSAWSDQLISLLKQKVNALNAAKRILLAPILP